MYWLSIGVYSGVEFSCAIFVPSGAHGNAGLLIPYTLYGGRGSSIIGRELQEDQIMVLIKKNNNKKLKKKKVNKVKTAIRYWSIKG